MQREVWLEEGLESLDFDHEQGSNMTGHWENHLVTVRGRVWEGCLGGPGMRALPGSSSSLARVKGSALCVQGTRSSRLLLFAQMMHMQNDTLKTFS